jgi:hypothetical protein
MDKEDQYVLLVDAVLSNGRLNNHVYDSLIKEQVNQTLTINNRALSLQESYRFNGAGLRIKHYTYPAKANEKFREEQFLMPQISTQARAITVHPMTVNVDGYINVIVIEEVH